MTAAPSELGGFVDDAVMKLAPGDACEVWMRDGSDGWRPAIFESRDPNADRWWCRVDEYGRQSSWLRSPLDIRVRDEHGMAMLAMSIRSERTHFALAAYHRGFRAGSVVFAISGIVSMIVFALCGGGR